MPRSFFRRATQIGSLAASCAICLALMGASRGAITKLTLDPKAPVVDLFEGEAQDQFEIRLVAQDAHDGKIFITNKTDKPLTVAMPKGLVGVQILGQFQGFNQLGNNGLANGMFGGPGGQNGQNGGGAQTVGGNAGPMGQNQFPNQGNGFPGGGQFPGAGPFFSIPPEKTVQLAFNSVCLNYGLREPHAGMKYKLAKAEAVTSDPALLQLLEDYSPRTNRAVQQAAAWHLANGLTWDQIGQLAEQKLAGDPILMFTPQQVQAAKALVEKSEKAAADRPKEKMKKIETARVVSK